MNDREAAEALVIGEALGLDITVQKTAVEGNVRLLVSDGIGAPLRRPGGRSDLRTARHAQSGSPRAQTRLRSGIRPAAAAAVGFIAVVVVLSPASRLARRYAAADYLDRNTPGGRRAHRFMAVVWRLPTIAAVAGGAAGFVITAVLDPR